ncbi:extracellular solute-binding protein [Leifsonia sp. NPDC014704]|uniref:sugar ABC transporter substrate-binding protein n=1 Tax=Leifsonia sp. NPDC014704 TaxID=3364123 RepID=UPI0036F46CC2
MHRNPKSRGSFRRAAAAVVGLSLAAAALAGCSSANGDSSKTLTVWHYYSVGTQVGMLDDFGKAFEKDNPGVKVDNVYVPHDQLNAKLVASVGTKSGPDVVVFDGYSATTLAAAGALAPLGKEWSAFSDASQFAAGSIAKLTNKIYSVQGYVNTLGLYYNKTILDKIGVKPPTTLDELNSAMAKAKSAGFGGMTLAGQPNLQGAFQAFPWLTSAGFSYDDPQQSALTNAFTTARKWVTDGYVSPEVSTWDQNVPFSKFTAGGIAFAENGNWQLAAIKKDANFEYGVVPLPLSDTGKVYLGGEAEGIGAFSKNPTLAWKYLQSTFYSKAGQLTALKSVGSIPTRKDAAADTSISSDPYLSQLATAISKQGAPFPDIAIPSKNIDTVYQDNGAAWSAALGGQQSPSEAASSFLKQLQPLLK